MNSTRLAVGTTDGLSVCDHLARSAAFHVLEIADGRIVSRTLRQWARDGCGNHAGFVVILQGCDAVLCGGIGEGAARSLEAHGIRPIVAARKHMVDEAVSLYLAGTLVTTGERVCLCQ